MAEIAMVSSHKTRLKRAQRRGEKTAEKALELSNNPGKFFSTVQIGITLIGILTGMYSGGKVAGNFEVYLSKIQWVGNYSSTLSITILVIILTFFSMVFGELLPKRIALILPETITKILAYPMYIVSLMAAPFIWLLTVTTDLFMRILNIKSPADSYVTEEEIKAIVQEATETGAVQKIEKDIVENVFHLGDRKISTLMTPKSDISWINTKDPPEATKLKIITSVHKSFPVCNEALDNVAGMVHSKEILNSILRNESFEIEKHLKPVLFLTVNTSAYKALEKFRETKQNLALVIDESRNVQGILTMNDLVDTLVGDFVKQLHENKEIIPRDDNSFLIDATLSLPELARYFDINISDDTIAEQLSTVGGLTFLFSKKAPYTGLKFKWKNLTFEIVDMDGKRVDKVLVKKESLI